MPLRHQAVVATPEPLSRKTAQALVAAAQRVAELEPWNYMADLHLVGVRDQPESGLRIASILGNRREVFGVNLYRNGPGLRWIVGMATGDEFAGNGAGMMLQGLDCCRVEWTARHELDAADLRLLSDANFQPAGHGPGWPKFQACVPGWYPWFVSKDEACQLTNDLGKIARFAALFRDFPDLYEKREPGEIPIVSAGNAPLHPEELDWVPVVPPPPDSDPLKLSSDEEAALLRLPMLEERVFELGAEFVPEFKLLDERLRRPQMGRVALMVDGKSFNVFASEATAPGPLSQAVRKVFGRGLQEAAVRPGRIRVDSPELGLTLGPVCEHLSIQIEISPDLPALRESFDALVKHVSAINEGSE